MYNISFEKINDEQLPDVLEIYNYYVLNSTATFHKHELSIQEIRDIVIFDDPKYVSFAISDADIICGYVILSQHKKREAYDKTAEITVYLNPEYKGKGIGKAAVKYIENFAKINKFHGLIATICGENTESIKLFERCGYIKCAHYSEVGYKFGKYLDLVAYQKIIE